jgi:hypothetical protein
MDATRMDGNAARRAAGVVAAAGCSKLPLASSIGCGFAARFEDGGCVSAPNAVPTRSACAPNPRAGGHVPGGRQALPQAAQEDKAAAAAGKEEARPRQWHEQQQQQQQQQ